MPDFVGKATTIIVRLGLGAFEKAKTVADRVEKKVKATTAAAKEATQAVRLSAREAQRHRRDALARPRLSAAEAETFRQVTIRDQEQARRRALSQRASAIVASGFGARGGDVSGTLRGLRQQRGDIQDVLGGGQALAAGDVFGALRQVIGPGGLLGGPAGAVAALGFALLAPIVNEIRERHARNLAQLLAFSRSQNETNLRRIEERLANDVRFRDRIAGKLAREGTAVRRATWQGGWTPQNALEVE